MKRIVQFSFLFFVFLVFLPSMANAQEEKTSTITITITEDGNVTTDTTFEIAEGQDPDAVKEMVEKLAGGDIHVKSSKHGHKKVMYMTGDEDAWHIHDIDIDSIKEAHDGAHVMVMKTEDGDINVKVLEEEDEDFEFESEEGGTYVVKVMKHGEGDCDVHVTEDHHVIISDDEHAHGNKKVIIKEYVGGEDGEGKKHIKVFIDEDDNVQILESGEDLEWVEEDEDGGEVIIIKSEDGETITVKKQIKVEIHEEDGEKSEDGEKKVVKKKKVKKEEE